MAKRIYTFFYDFKEKDVEKQYFIVEGFYRYLPFWHEYFDEETIYNFKQVGSVEVHAGKTIKVISDIDGGYSDDEIDYYVTSFAYIESENENGLKSKIPNILKLMFEKYKMFRDTPKGTVFTEESFNDEHDYDCEYDCELGYDYGEM